MRPKSFLGVFVPTAYVQSEGAPSVLGALESAGATAICLTTTVVAEVDRNAAGAVRFPDLHVDGWDRVLERPLFGRQELWVRNYAGYESDHALYEGGPYRPIPSAPDDLPGRGAVQELIDAARTDGLEVYLHLQPTVPPLLADSDVPVLVSGGHPRRERVSPAGCPNRPAIRAYARAVVKDVLQGLRGIDGLLIDWAEFPVYHFDELFTCCCDACATRAEELGYDWAALAEAMRAGWEMYHGLKPADADSFIRQFRAARGDAGALLRSIPHLDEFFAFKAASVELLYAELAEAAESAGRPDLRLAARGWAPPWNQASGFDLARLSAVCSMISPKIFTFDYAALPRWWGEELAEWNPALSEEQICDLLVEALDLPDELEPRRFAKYAIPKPGESHNTRPESHAGRLRTMIAAMDGSRAMLCPVVHSYLPTDDWKRMVDLAKAVGVDGIWIQMLGYLPTEKVAIARSFWDVAPPQPQGEEAHR